MLAIMSQLETRYYEKGEVIANEMDESQEVLFIIQGKYDVGYEINKQKFMVRRFGPSTVIGGFEMCFYKKFLFCYTANTHMHCFSIRKEHFIKILKQFDEFRYHIKYKCWNHFSN